MVRQCCITLWESYRVIRFMTIQLVILCFRGGELAWGARLWSACRSRAGVRGQGMQGHGGAEAPVMALGTLCRWAVTALLICIGVHTRALMLNLCTTFKKRSSFSSQHRPFYLDSQLCMRCNPSSSYPPLCPQYLNMKDDCQHLTSSAADRKLSLVHLVQVRSNDNVSDWE